MRLMRRSMSGTPAWSAILFSGCWVLITTAGAAAASWRTGIPLADQRSLESEGLYATPGIEYYARPDLTLSVGGDFRGRVTASDRTSAIPTATPG